MDSYIVGFQTRKEVALCHLPITHSPPKKNERSKLIYKKNNNIKLIISLFKQKEFLTT